MPRLDYVRCRLCGKHRDEVGLLSRTRLCTACSKARVDENIDGIALHRGPAFRRWREAMAASVGGVLLDAPPAHGQTRD